MKKSNLLVVAFGAIILASMLLVSCGPSINGTWVHSDGFELTFKGEKVDMSFGGEVFQSGTYKTNGNKITITEDDESEEGTFTIEGDKLSITFGGETDTFTRKK
ncbi:MAG: hypothetical protein FWC01_02250 [Treponema sp.]|nr:hypothetical protein [Treponema sp.]MCL2237157.1 hypothetical protein [Treponema sp.]